MDVINGLTVSKPPISFLSLPDLIGQSRRLDHPVKPDDDRQRMMPLLF